MVHMSAGYTALVGAWYIGPRLSSGERSRSSIPHVLLGAALMWFGW